jgi:hypothetical protein
MEWCLSTIKGAAATCKGECKVGVDISSFSRFRTAAFVAAVLQIRTEARIIVDFVYAGALFSEPIDAGPMTSAGPVLPAFAGWSSEPDRPCVAVFGLGYELEKAVGVLEYLEPTHVWAFQPVGHDRRYTKAIALANRTFLESLPASRVVFYNIWRPAELVGRLESLIFGALRSARPMLIPFGPKIFTLSCLLVASLHYPEVPVWRVSPGDAAPPQDRVPNGKVIGLRVDFSTQLPET